MRTYKPAFVQIVRIKEPFKKHDLDKVFAYVVFFITKDDVEIL